MKEGIGRVGTVVSRTFEAGEGFSVNERVCRGIARMAGMKIWVVH